MWYSDVLESVGQVVADAGLTVSAVYETSDVGLILLVTADTFVPASDVGSESMGGAL